MKISPRVLPPPECSLHENWPESIIAHVYSAKMVILPNDGGFLLRNPHRTRKRPTFENVLVLHESAVAARYMHEWDRLWAESEELKPRY
jgi:hypothetical protein